MTTILLTETEKSTVEAKKKPVEPVIEWESTPDGECRFVWTEEAYHFAAANGIIDPNMRVELINGQLYKKHPEKGEEERLLWTRDAQNRAIETGFFDSDLHVELINGDLYFRMAINRSHTLSVRNTARALEAIFFENCYVERQNPILISESDSPEPDVFVVRGTPEDYMDQPGPEFVDLLVEVSDSTERKDRGIKAADYAAAGIADYWIVLINSRELEVCREPEVQPENSLGWGYKSITRYPEDQSVAPLARPDAAVRVADLLPPADLKTEETAATEE